MLSSVSRRLTGRGRSLQPLLVRAFQSSGDKLAADPEPVPLSKLKDSFLDGTSSTYLEELEERYRANPRSVDKSWASFFHSMGKRTSEHALGLPQRARSKGLPRAPERRRRPPPAMRRYE